MISMWFQTDSGRSWKSDLEAGLKVGEFLKVKFNVICLFGDSHFGF